MIHFSRASKLVVSKPVCFAMAMLFLPLPGFAAANDDPSNNEDLAELVLPTQQIELGLAAVEGNRKGLAPSLGMGDVGKNKALFGIGELDFRGGGLYFQENPSRWRLQLEESGIGMRRLLGEVGEQGRYGFRFAHDEQYFLLSDTYRTPLLGAGTDRLTLPAGFASRTAVGPSALPALSTVFSGHTLDIQRTQSSVKFHTLLNDVWTLRAGFQHESREGTKGTGALSGSSGGTVMILPEAIRQATDRFNLNLAYGENRQHFQLGYVGAIFQNQVDKIDFQNPFSAGLLDNRMGVAPDNQLHQLKLDGGMNFSSNTRLTGALSRGRLTQSEAFLPYATSSTLAALPQTSLNGLVLTENRFLQLTSKPWRDLNLLASYRYDDRDNQTPIGTYQRVSNEAVSTTATVQNTPYRRQRTTTMLEADYALSRTSRFVVGNEQEVIQRTCRQDGVRCVDSEHSTEQAWRSEIRQTFNDWFSGRLGFRHGDRHVDDYTPVDATTELAGMRKFIYADRSREQIWANATLLATESLAFGARLDLNDDRYTQSQYGLDHAGSWVAHLDVNYAVNDDFSLYGYLSRQEIGSRLGSRYSKNVTDIVTVQPNQEWQARMRDGVDAVGVGFRHQGLMAGRLELSSDLSLVQTQSEYLMSGGACTNSTCTTKPTSLADLPTVRSRQWLLRTDARYSLTSETSLRLMGVVNYQRNHDYAYDLVGATSSNRILGTSEIPPNYLGYFLGLSVIHRFR
ncbi:MAG: rane protein [Pseudomonadota bacterium]|jgi:MtrB/PioB family decaheme-associated outer membrane protein